MYIILYISPRKMNVFPPTLTKSHTIFYPSVQLLLPVVKVGSMPMTSAGVVRSVQRLSYKLVVGPQIYQGGVALDCSA